MTPISGEHASNVINYMLYKEKAKKEDKPVFLRANHLEVNPLTGLPFSAQEILMDMKLRQATSGHNIKDPYWRCEFCPPPEVCRNWDMEQWGLFLDDCVMIADSLIYRGRHLMLANSQFLTAVHFDSGKYHVHFVGNRVTEDNQVMDTHQYKRHAKAIANAIAEKYCWSKAEDRGNLRKERIHTDALTVLKRMSAWNIDDYFRGMQNLGWKVEPRYDSNGVCRGYSIGEDLYTKDGTYSGTVMYKASELGYGRDLTVSKLVLTWQKLHPKEQEEREQSKPQPVVKSPQIHKPKVLSADDEEYLHLKAIKEFYEKEVIESKPVRREPTNDECERQSAIGDAVKAIQHILGGPWCMFSIREMEDVLPPAIIARAIDGYGSALDADNRKNAVHDLVGMVEDVADCATETIDTIEREVLSFLLPDTTPSLGGGSSNNDLSKKKDDEWEWWKRNAFGMKQRRKGQRR